MHDEPVTKKILIVDDTEDIAHLLSMIFRLLGYETIVASDGLQAVDQAAKCEPDLVFMDICMPGIDGYEATQRIHDIPTLSHVPVVAMSANSRRDWLKRAMAAG